MSQPFKSIGDAAQDGVAGKKPVDSIRKADERALNKAVKSDKFHRIVHPYDEQSDVKPSASNSYAQVIPTDLPDGSYSAEDLRQRARAREEAHNALIIARARHTKDASTTDEDAEMRSNAHDGSFQGRSVKTYDAGSCQRSFAREKGELSNFSRKIQSRPKGGSQTDVSRPAGSQDDSWLKSRTHD